MSILVDVLAATEDQMSWPEAIATSVMMVAMFGFLVFIVWAASR